HCVNVGSTDGDDPAVHRVDHRLPVGVADLAGGAAGRTCASSAGDVVQLGRVCPLPDGRGSVLVLLLVAGLGAGADLDALIDKSPIAARASIGIHVVDTKTGKTVYERNADHLLLPASNLKLFTAALALEKLGPDYRFVTRLVRTANGDLVLVGS